jgi:DNA-binding CsgD family transcriptional regulator
LFHANDNNIKLTPYELERVRLTAQHKTAKEIARQSQLSTRTIGFHIETAINKLNVCNK